MEQQPASAAPLAMLHVRPVTDFELPELAPYRSMRWQSEHRQQGIFVAEGEKVVRRLLESNLKIKSLLLPEKWLSEYRELLEKRDEEIHAFTAEKALLETLTGFSMYQGVLAVAEIPRPITLDEALALPSRPLLFVALDSLSSAENLGGLVRNCVAFGVNALLVGETSCSPYLRRAVRSSMGTIFKLPVIETDNLANSIQNLRAHNVRCVAAHPHTNEKTLSAADFKQDVCLVLGSEGQGISPHVLKSCDEAVLIPMLNQVDSLNVGTAGAVFLYEVQRQRGKG
jgi:tRNA G18 (ribose-2'-O)-methylase SpoU